MTQAIHAYAQALLKLADQDVTVLENLQNELKLVLSAYYANREMQNVLESYMITRQEKKSIIQKMIETLNLSPVTARFLFLLLDHGHLKFLKSIWIRYQELMVRERSGVLIEVESAQPWQESLKRRVMGVFQKRNDPVYFQWIHTPALIAGLRFTIEGRTYDGSLRSDLEHLMRRFAEKQDELLAKRLVKQMV